MKKCVQIVIHTYVCRYRSSRTAHRDDKQKDSCLNLSDRNQISPTLSRHLRDGFSVDHFPPFSWTLSYDHLPSAARVANTGTRLNNATFENEKESSFSLERQRCALCGLG